jgi:hypothetical protein
VATGGRRTALTLPYKFFRAPRVVSALLSSANGTHDDTYDGTYDSIFPPPQKGPLRLSAEINAGGGK